MSKASVVNASGGKKPIPEETFENLLEKIVSHPKFDSFSDYKLFIPTWEKMIAKNPSDFEKIESTMQKILDKMNIKKEQELELRALKSKEFQCEFEDCDTPACLKMRGRFLCKDHKNICFGECRNDLSQMCCECAFLVS